MAAVSEDPISLWLKLGALEKLEQVVLDGYGDQLYGKTSRIPQVNKFLRQVPLFQGKIDEIHKAVSTGNLRDVQHLIDRKKLAFCRDNMGASPMHKAVLFKQKPIIDYLLDRYPSVVHARDHRGRTPLHYAAVLSDSGEIYKMLLDHGADIKATDVFGNRPEYYMHAQDEIDIDALKGITSENKHHRPIRVRNFLANGDAESQKEPILAKSAKPAGNRTQIREILNSGNVESLEQLVLQGHGDRLLGETNGNPIVRDFIKMVPIYMERIHDIHRAVTRGRLRDVQTLLDRKKLALARDPLGATPLHKAVMYGHKEVAQYICTNFPLSKDAKDLDGRTPLHYSAALKDNHDMYNMLISLGANPLVLDYRGKTAEYYLQFPEHMHLDQLIKQSQRANANYMANHANRMKINSPKRKSPYPARASFAVDLSANTKHVNGDVSEEEENSEPPKNGHVTFKLPKKTLFRSQPLLPPPKLKRIEVNSANIKRWVREEDIEKLEGAVLEGYGEKVASQKSDNEKLQQYIDQVPMLVKKIEAIHIAVSHDDITELQSQLLDTDYMVLAKDHFGMAPIHRAVLMNKPETLAFLIDRFPETVNAKDKEGRTALHYAAAMSREPGASNYFKMLLEAGADSRIRDNQGRSAEYYRTHHVPIPIKLNQQFKGIKKLRSKSEPPPQNRVKKLPGINGSGSLPQVMMDKINNWLQSGDIDRLKDFVQDGYGQHLAGKTSWNEEVRQYIKQLPLYLMSLSSSFHAVERGDISSLDRIISTDESLLKARNADGSTLIHHAVFNDHLDIVNYFLTNYPNLLNIKDRNGRTPLHVAGQQKNQYLYSVLAAAGADPMILDNKGRTAEFYMASSTKPAIKPQISPSSSTPENESSGEKSNPSAENDSDKPKDSDLEENTGDTPENDQKKDEDTQEDAVRTETGVTPPPEEPEGDKDADAEEKEEKNEESKETDGENNPDEDEKQKDGAEDEKTESAKQEENDDQKLKVENNDNEDKKSATSKASDAAVSSSGDRLNELIDVWIRDRDLLRLEHVVIAGQGDRLIGRTSDDRQVQEFLELVTTYMARIKGVHDAVIRGNLGEVESVLTRKRFALSRDQLGASPLHLAVLHGHTDVVKYIIDNFPEALDGPDNEGRTPLHFAAVMRDGGNYYRILLMAGADEMVVDKAGHTPDYYLTHPGVLTIRDLLEGYRIKEGSNRRPSQVNIWQRPPTDDADKRDFFDEEDEIDPFLENVTTPHFSDSTTSTNGQAGQNEEEQEEEEEKQVASIYPILFDKQNRDSRYLASVLGDALIKGLTQVARRRPRDPIGYLATYLYQYAARKSAVLSGSKEDEFDEDAEETEGNSSPVKEETAGDISEDNEETKNEDAGKALEVLEETPDEFEDEDDEEFALEFEDHTKMKDEEGQTVLHFAAARVHPDGSFYALLSHAESLLAERDALYRTCRDVADESGQQENLTTIDRFVFDAYLQQRSAFLQMLLHDGYDHLIHISDGVGRDLASVLQQQRLHSSMSMLRDVADFIKRREELHGYIRNRYLEGVARLVKSDGNLVTAKGTRARCALHVAVLFEHPGVINALIRANSAAVHVADNLGRTPLHYAMATEKVDKIAKILVKAGALRSTKDVKMRTPSYFFIYKDEIRALYEEELRLA